MKRFILFVPLLLSLNFFACKKAKGPANGKSVSLNNNLDSNVSMSAVINGASWQTDSAFGYTVKHSGNDSGLSDLFITATQMNTAISTITFNITNFAGPGTYTINPPINTVIYYYGNSRHMATTGQVVVTSDTAYALKGVFNFTADTVVVSDGEFNVAKP